MKWRRGRRPMRSLSTRVSMWPSAPALDIPWSRRGIERDFQSSTPRRPASLVRLTGPHPPKSTATQDPGLSRHGLRSPGRMSSSQRSLALVHVPFIFPIYGLLGLFLARADTAGEQKSEHERGERVGRRDRRLGGRRHGGGDRSISGIPRLVGGGNPSSEDLAQGL